MFYSLIHAQWLRVIFFLALALLPGVGASGQEANPPTPPTVIGPHAGSNAALERSMAAYRRSDLATALQEIEAILAVNEQNPEIVAWYGYLLLRAGKYDTAIPYFERLITLGRDTADTYRNLGHALIMRPSSGTEDIKRAVTYFEKAYELKPGSPETQSQLGIAYFKMGEFERAATTLKQSLEKDPEQGKIWLYLGYSCYRLNRLEDAGEALRKGLEYLPEDVDGRISLGAVAIKRKQADEAVQILAEARRLAPQNIQVLNNLAVAYTDTNKFLEAAEVYGALAAISTNGSAVIARYNQGISLSKADRTAEAIQAYEAALTLDGKHFGALVNLGTLLFQAGNIARAGELFSRATQVRPEAAEGWANLAAVHDKTANYKAGADAWKKAMTADPANISYRKYYRADLERSQQYTALLTEGAKARGTEGAEGLRQTGAAFYDRAEASTLASAKQRNLVAALKALKEAVRQEPNNASAWNDLAVVHERRGEIIEALTAYKKARALEPSNVKYTSNLNRFLTTPGGKKASNTTFASSTKGKNVRSSGSVPKTVSGATPRPPEKVVLQP